MVKLIIGSIVFLMVIALGSYLYLHQPPATVLLPTPSPTTAVTRPASQSALTAPALPQGTTVPQTNGTSYQDPKGIYTINYPLDYTLDLENNGEFMRLSKKGATQQGQTELYDGVIMVFGTAALKGQTLTNWVDARIKSDTADGTLTLEEAKKPVVVHTYHGFTYTMRGLGTSQYIVLQKDATAPNAVIITMSVIDPQQKGFQKEVDSILATLTLLQ